MGFARWIVVAIALQVSCLDSATHLCSNGVVCPADQQCVADGCARSVQLEVCASKSEGDSCTYLDLVGTCRNGVCRSAACGNRMVDPGEACDDGNQISGDGCSEDCRKAERCGDGAVDRGEECDDGNKSDADGCSAGCRLERCGNGIIDPGEACDDGNVTAGDGCAPNCASTELCGNNVVDPGEACDDGNKVSADGCSDDCASNETCGNHVLDIGEGCDDGNLQDSDGCEHDCTVPGCGNGIIDPGLGEDCDNAGANSSAANALCRTDCSARRCGDGTIDSANSELCEAGQLAGKTCLDFGFYAASGLACGPTCDFDTASCTQYCGDGVVNGPGVERCDGAPPAPTCAGFGFDIGRPTCTASCSVGLGGCERIGFIDMTSPTDHFLSGVWVAPDRTAVAVGGYYPDGNVLAFDGATWSNVTLPPGTSFLNGVWGRTTTDVFAVGNGGTIIHFDGQWTSQTSTTTKDLDAVWGTGTDVFAAGAGGTILRFSGTTWTPMTSGVTTKTLYGIWGTSSSNVYAVGDQTLLHYDGNVAGTWSQTAMPDTLVSVWGANATDIYAVGYASSQGVIYHYNGAWSKLTIASDLPSIYNGSPPILNAVWGSGNDVFAIATTPSGSDPINILHHGPQGWTFLDAGPHTGMYAIGGSGPDNVIVVGTNGQILRGHTVGWGDTGYGAQYSYSAIWQAGTSVSVAGLFAPMRHDATTVGWQALASLPGAYALEAGWGTSANNGYVVGSASISGNGAILHYTTNTWTAEAPTTTKRLYGVSGTGPGDIVAVGAQGVIVGSNGSSWSTIAAGSASSPDWYGVWALDSQTRFLAGTNGSLARLDGATVTPMTSPTTKMLWGIWGIAGDDVFAVGNGGTILRFDGTSWRAMASGTTADLYAVSGSGPSDVWTVGNGVALHFDGANWLPIAAPPSLYDLAVTRSDVFFIGTGMPRFVRSCVASELACDDRWDDDCDGLLDCADPDCAASAQCANGGVCRAVDDLTCGQMLDGTSASGVARIDDYRCGSRTETGTEVAYRLVPPASGQVTIDLVNPTADLDVIVVGAYGTGGCDLHTCIATSTTGGAVTKAVSFTAVGGQTYYVIVDGQPAAAGTFALGATCP